MIKTRKNSFETNSSSMHSFVITNEEVAKELREDKDIYFSHDEMLESLHCVDGKGVYKPLTDFFFGREPFRMLYTFEEKFQYAYANFYGDKENYFEQLMDIFYELLPEVNRVELPKYCGVDEYKLKSWLNKNGISIREFLTNTKYTIIQDGDEYCIWEDLCDSGLIDLDIIKQCK